MEDKVTKEVIEKIRGAKSETELGAVLKEAGIECPEPVIKMSFKNLTEHGEEVSDEDLTKSIEAMKKNAGILGQKLDEKQLESISGGATAHTCSGMPTQGGWCVSSWSCVFVVYYDPNN